MKSAWVKLGKIQVQSGKLLGAVVKVTCSLECCHVSRLPAVVSRYCPLCCLSTWATCTVPTIWKPHSTSHAVASSCNLHITGIRRYRYRDFLAVWDGSRENRAGYCGCVLLDVADWCWISEVLHTVWSDSAQPPLDCQGCVRDLALEGIACRADEPVYHPRTFGTRTGCEGLSTSGCFCSFRFFFSLLQVNIVAC